jgi:protein phosphatase
MQITIPRLSLVVLIGPSGSGKSTFARTHFLPSEILSSDACRAMVGDDENDQAVTKDALDVLHFIAGKRLALGRLTVIDATNVQVEARRPLVELARRYHCLPVALVLDLPERVCQARTRSRPEWDFSGRAVRNQKFRLRSRGLGRKRALALGEFALGVEALERFVRREPLRRVHECVFGVLALENEPVDPRL